MFCVLLCLFVQVLAASAATADQWRSRSIYQLLTDRFALTNGSTIQRCDTSERLYCGGTYQGIINKLDYIQNLGFSAVWISPVTHQQPMNDSGPAGSSYHGYYQNDLYSLNPAFGTQNDLQALSKALHQRDMYLMLDIVVNHFSWPGPPDTVNYSSYNPFNDISHFHPFCQITDADYTQNQTAVEDCWLGDDINQLTDLNTQSPLVQKQYQTWITQLISNYSIDGLRIDTVKHVQPSFWGPFTQAAGIYAVGEVADGSISYVSPYQNYLGNTTSGILNYPGFYALTAAFTNTTANMSLLANFVNDMKDSCPDTNLLGSFLENHDQPRFPSLTNDTTLRQNAIAFSMLADGIPIVYQGQEAGLAGGSDPANREALWLTGYDTSNPWYLVIQKLNRFRNFVVKNDPGYTTYKAWPIFENEHVIAMRKGSNDSAVVGVYSNEGLGGGKYVLNVGRTGYVPGTKVVEVMRCQEYTVGNDSSLDVDMESGAVRVFYPESALMGSGICDGDVLGDSGLCRSRAKVVGF